MSASCLRLVTTLGLLFVLKLNISSAATHKESDGIIALQNGEEYGLLIGENPKVRTPWVDISKDRGSEPWVYMLTLDQQGNVTDAVLESGPKDQRDEALRAALSLRFKPFERKGRAVAVRFHFSIPGEPEDYRGPPDRAFGSDDSLKELVVALRRTTCFGTCPDYRVEIQADGQVTYHGNAFVLVKGTYRWRVSPAAVTDLIQLLRRADFFKLDGYYTLNASDLPTYVTRVSVGTKDKFVLNYGGSGMGGAAASTSFGGPSPNMPSVVTEIENAIDQAVDDASWIKGDEKTIPRLEAAHWNFQSKAGGQALNMLISDCNSDLARQFLARGAPVTEHGEGWLGGSTPAAAAHCADLDLVRELIAKGALNGPKARKAFFLSSVDSGNPEMVALALKYFRNLNVRDGEGKPLLSIAANATSRTDDAAVNLTYDPARVISMLVAKKADVNAKDSDGNTALFEASSEDVVRVLIGAGADPNARNSKGKTPLFDHYFAAPKRALLEAGAEVTIRDNFGENALFDQDSAEAVRILIAAGADVNATAHNGHTALDAAGSEEVALILVKAGARLPTDLDGLDRLTKKATARKWTQLLSLLKNKP
jgi:ankyrin repeat protein